MSLQLDFDEATHTYTVAGVRWPSVTQVLEPLQLLDGIPPDILRAAADFGVNVHAACHLLNVGALDIDTLDAALAPYVSAWSKFIADTGAKVIASELRVAHGRLRYAGTLDTICLIDGTRELVDIKSTAAIPRTVAPQTAAYAEAMGEPRIKRRVVQLRRDGTYRTARLTDRSDFNLFLSALNIWNWRQRHARS
jgi:hypothetical protein